jgi:hypothetical protein
MLFVSFMLFVIKYINYQMHLIKYNYDSHKALTFSAPELFSFDLKDPLKMQLWWWNM